MTAVAAVSRIKLWQKFYSRGDGQKVRQTAFVLGMLTMTHCTEQLKHNMTFAARSVASVDTSVENNKALTANVAGLL